MDIVKSGSTWILRTAPILDVTNARLTGLTDIKCSVSRYTSGAWQWLDFADMTFKASPGTLQATMTAVDATKAAGVYAYALDTSTITNATLGDQLFIDIQQTTLTNAINANQAGGGVYGYIVDKVEANLTVATSTLATSTNVSDAQTAILAKLPSALVGGRIDASVGAMAANTLTASALAADAVTEIQSGLATSTALATAQSDITTIVGYGAPPSAATVSAAVVDQALSGHTTSGTVGEALSHADVATSTRLASASYTAPPSAVAISAQVNADITTAHGAGSYQTASTAGLATGTNVSDAQAAILAKLPAALVGGRIDASVGAMAANVVTAAAVATGAIDADAVAADAVTEIQSGLATSAALATMQGNVTTILGYGAPPSAAANAAAVWATVESTGANGTMGGSLWKTRRRLTQRASTSALGVVTLYLDDNVTPETTFTLTDVDGNAVTIVAGDPARRSAET